MFILFITFHGLTYRTRFAIFEYMVYVCKAGTKTPITPVSISPLEEKYYDGIFIKMSGNKVDFLLKYVDEVGLPRTGILSRSRHIPKRIAHIDFNGEIIKHKDLVENYSRVIMLIEQEKTKAAIDSLE